MKGKIDVSRSEAAAILGRIGGQARMVKMTPKERTRVARRAAEARWAYQKLKDSTNGSLGGKNRSKARDYVY